MDLSRRNFMKAGLASLAYFTTASTVPMWLSKSAEALCRAPMRRLVIIQLAGGNDGLNTVIPYTDPIYTGSQLLNGSEIRPKLKILEPDLGLTKLGDGRNAFHPQLVRLSDWYKNGNVAVLQNVGYPNPNLSHFMATDNWEIGRSPGGSQAAKTGWTSRFFDNTCAGTPVGGIDPVSMMALGRPIVPPMINGSAKYTPPAVADFDAFKLDMTGHPLLEDHQRSHINALNNVASIDPTTDFVSRTAINAQASIADMAVASQEPDLNAYPEGTLGSGLQMVSKIIRAGFPTRVFYVYQTGYDTHADQFAGNPITTGVHPLLLEEFDGAVDAFMRDMHQSGRLHDTLVMTFSEFGRRIAENGSSGTDHGAANSMFVLGGRALRGGVYGGQPDLANHLNFNLRHNVDFRSVYSRIIQDWFEQDPVPVFGEDDFFDPIIKIGADMSQIPFIDPAAFATRATSGAGCAAAVGVAAAAGALAVQRISRDRERGPVEIRTGTG